VSATGQCINADMLCNLFGRNCVSFQAPECATITHNIVPAEEPSQSEDKNHKKASARHQ
jgi:hypothetical protein